MVFIYQLTMDSNYINQAGGPMGPLFLFLAEENKAIDDANTLLTLRNNNLMAQNTTLVEQNLEQEATIVTLEEQLDQLNADFDQMTQYSLYLEANARMGPGGRRMPRNFTRAMYERNLQRVQLRVDNEDWVTYDGGNTWNSVIDLTQE